MPAESAPPPPTLGDPLLPVDPEHAARMLGVALRDRHAQSLDPADRTAAWTLPACAERVLDRARASSATTMPEGPYRGRTVVASAELGCRLAAAAAERPTAPLVLAPLVLDLRLSDWVLCPDGTVTLAAGRTSSVIGDPHLDLAAAAAELQRGFGPAVVAPMIQEYGDERVDLRSLDTAQLLVAVAGVTGWPPPVSEMSDV